MCPCNAAELDTLPATLTVGLVNSMGVANVQTLGTITLPVNYNSVLYGPITIEDDQVVTIGVDSNVAIVDISDA